MNHLRIRGLRDLRERVPQGKPPWGLMLGVALGAGVVGHATTAAADAAPNAEVRVILATKCDSKTIDPKIGEPAPPKMGYDCLQLLDKKTMALPLNQASSMALPNGRSFQLLHTGKAGNRFKVTAAVSQPDGGASKPLGNITAEPNVPFNVGGITYQNGVLFLTVRIVP